MIWTRHTDTSEYVRWYIDQDTKTTRRDMKRNHKAPEIHEEINPLSVHSGRKAHKTEQTCHLSGHQDTYEKSSQQFKD